MASPHLRGVPAEILLHIASYLTNKEFRRFRHTCRHIEASLFSSFAFDFFSKRQFCFTEFSLQALVDISQSRLGPSLTHLVIHLEHAPTEWAFWPSTSAPPSLDEDLMERFRFLTSTGIDVEMLTEAFKSLTNLRTIGIRDFNSKNCLRGETEMHSYGSRTYHKHFMCTLEQPQPHDGQQRTFGNYETKTHIHHVIWSLLRALGLAKKARPSRLEVILHKCQLSTAVLGPIPRRLEPTVLPVIANLKTILLDGITGPYPMMLANFLLKAADLKHLRLNFQGMKAEDIKEVLSWLADGPYDQTDAEDRSVLGPLGWPLPPAFPHLQHLDIGMAKVNQDTLVNLYSRYRATLRYISLHKVELQCEWPCGSDGEVNGWILLFREIAKLNLDLSQLRLSRILLTYIHQGYHHRPDTWVPVVTRFTDQVVALRVWTKSDMGHEMQGVLDAFAPQYLNLVSPPRVGP
ncbi:hypothetical protein GGR56DRAFT_614851 [Xylariaceae sp. FL0804]|nr:hypothetical protein GGR56DRAFT_614851 [Xylariaceae sp. FL0804]